MTADPVLVKPVSAAQEAREEKERVRTRLKEIFDANPVLYTRVIFTSRGNTSARMVTLASHPRYGINSIARLLCIAMGYRYSDTHDAVITHVLGMDRGFELAYSLSECLYGEGYVIRNQRF